MASEIKVSLDSFNTNSYWSTAISENDIFTSINCVDLFDQNGYHLTPIEQLYAAENGCPLTLRRHETVIRKPWLSWDNIKTGPHINHSDLFERKAYSEAALEQLKHYANTNNLLWKIVKMKPKYGIDISIDFVDNEGNVFEVFHYEWDSFEFEPIQERKAEIELFVVNQDWDLQAKKLLKRKNEWFNLDFFEQSKWRTDFYNLPPEKFKQIIWDN